MLLPPEEFEMVLFILLRLNWTPSISLSIIFLVGIWLIELLLPNPGVEADVPIRSELKRERWFRLGCCQLGCCWVSDKLEGFPVLIRFWTWLFAVSSLPKSSIKSLMTRTSIFRLKEKNEIEGHWQHILSFISNYVFDIS